jgi:hypothetical protein
MDVDAGQLRGSRVRRTRIALGLGFALALVAGLSASALRVLDAPTTIACYAALANDLTPLFDPAAPVAATSSPACPSP